MTTDSSAWKKLANYFEYDSYDKTADDLLIILIRLEIDGKFAVDRFDKLHGSSQDTGVSTARSSCDLREFLGRLVYECTPKELSRLSNLVFPVKREYKELKVPNYKITKGSATSKITRICNTVSGVVLYLLNKQNEQFPRMVFDLFEVMNVRNAFNGIPYSTYSTKNPKVALELTTRFKKFLEQECYYLDDDELGPFLNELINIDFDHTLYQDHLPGREMVDFYYCKREILFEDMCKHVKISSLTWIVLDYLFPHSLRRTNLLAFSELIQICF